MISFGISLYRAFSSNLDLSSSILSRKQKDTNRLAIILFRTDRVPMLN